MIDDNGNKVYKKARKAEASALAKYNRNLRKDFKRYDHILRNMSILQDAGWTIEHDNTPGDGIWVNGVNVVSDGKCTKGEVEAPNCFEAVRINNEHKRQIKEAQDAQKIQILESAGWTKVELSDRYQRSRRSNVWVACPRQPYFQRPHWEKIVDNKFTRPSEWESPFYTTSLKNAYLQHVKMERLAIAAEAERHDAEMQMPC